MLTQKPKSVLVAKSVKFLKIKMGKKMENFHIKVVGYIVA